MIFNIDPIKNHMILAISYFERHYRLLKPRFNAFNPYMMFSSIHVGFFHYSHYTLSILRELTLIRMTSKIWISYHMEVAYYVITNVKFLVD